MYTEQLQTARAKHTFIENRQIGKNDIGLKEERSFHLCIQNVVQYCKGTLSAQISCAAAGHKQAQSNDQTT